MRKQFGALALSLGLALVVSATHAAPIVGTFTGSAAGQGLDLQGDFDYALSINALANGVQVGDALFTNAASTPGASINNNNMNQAWYNATYSGSAADLALGTVMNTVVWNYADGQPGPNLILTLGGLTVGNTYKVQLMFGEGCCSRGFDVFQDGAMLVADFSPSALMGIGDGSRSAFIADTFVATGTSVMFGFGGSAPFGDNNPILNAATLEALDAPVAEVPEPATVGTLLAGLGIMGFLRRRKARA